MGDDRSTDETRVILKGSERDFPEIFKIIIENDYSYKEQWLDIMPSFFPIVAYGGQ